MQNIEGEGKSTIDDGEILKIARRIKNIFVYFPNLFKKAN